MESADRVLRVLEIFGPTDRELTLSDIAERMQLPKSSVHRLLATLIARGYVERDGQNHRYSLGIRLFEVGSNVIHGRGLHAAAHPILEELTMATGETSHLAVSSGTEAVYVYKMDSHSTIQMPSRVGGRAPGHATSIGKVLLAWGASDIRKEIGEHPLKAYTRNTIVELRRLDTELELVRKRGYATDLEEFEIGLRCIAAPVHDMTDRVIAAVGIAAPAIRLTKDNIPRTVEAVTAAGKAISRQLGHIRHGIRSSRGPD
jgi:DNA-binding IclR family transcriptional regulator